jgi:hypothetical protein
MGMRSKLDLHNSTNAGNLNKLGMSAMSRMPRMPQARMHSKIPLEWLDAGSWRLPSGKALAEFALQAGFLAPLLLKTERFGGREERSDALDRTGRTVVLDGAKQCGKGSAR